MALPQNPDQFRQRADTAACFFGYDIDDPSWTASMNHLMDCIAYARRNPLATPSDYMSPIDIMFGRTVVDLIEEYESLQP